MKNELLTFILKGKWHCLVCCFMLLSIFLAQVATTVTDIIKDKMGEMLPGVLEPCLLSTI